MGFPGGRRQASDADDYAAAVRECREERSTHARARAHALGSSKVAFSSSSHPPHTPQEVGLELEDSAAFEFLGRLPDRDITARGQRMADSALAAFVFAQRPGTAEPRLAVQASEIAATRWAHESCFRPAEVQYNVHRPYSLLPDRVASLLPPALLRSVGLDRVSFPAVELCALALPSDSRHRASR